MSGFIPGLRLSELFYREAVEPILARAFLGLRYSAALLGTGSEVLGYDTIQSTDHSWGPGLLLFLPEDGFERYARGIVETLRNELPHEFRGYATSFAPAAGEERTLLPVARASGPVDHRVQVVTVKRFLADRLGMKSYPKVEVVDWLLCPEQRLLELTAGAVFYDGLGELEAARTRFDYYPHDVWLYLLAAQWKRIGQQEPFVGRCGDVGDELGSAIVAASLVRDLIRLCFLIERTYAPYSKWLGTAFASLDCAPRLVPLLTAVTSATSWKERERHLGAAYIGVATMHNHLAITEPLSTQVSRFHRRPYLVIDAERFSRAIRERIDDAGVRRLPEDIGAVDQWVDSTDVLTNNELRARLVAVYGSA